MSKVRLHFYVPFNVGFVVMRKTHVRQPGRRHSRRQNVFNTFSGKA